MKLILIYTILAIPIILAAQATFWEEPFDDNSAGWNLDSNWSIADGRLQFYYSPIIENYDLTAVSPIIQLPENVGDLVLKQWISTYSIVDEVAEISVLHGENETVLWQYEMIQGNWGETDGSELSFSLSQMGGESIRLQFRSYGSSTWNLNNWNIYDLVIYAMYDYDLALTDFVGGTTIEQNTFGNWSVEVENKGLNTVENFGIRFYREETVITEISNSEPIASEEMQSFEFNYLFENTGNYTLSAEVLYEEDEFLENNYSDPFEITVYPEGTWQVLIWDNDNNSYLTDPESYQTVGCEYALEQALEANDTYHNTVTILPDYLDEYDAIFATLGIYCLG